MSTHGDLLIIDQGSEKGQLLHAYSDGHTEDIYEALKTLPKFFFERAKLAKKLGDPSLGKGWFIDQWSVEQWNCFLNVRCECWSSTVSGMIVNYYFDRWLPLPEKEEDSEPDIKVICHGYKYEVIPHDDLKEEFPPFEVNFLEDLKELFISFDKEQKSIKKKKKKERIFVEIGSLSVGDSFKTINSNDDTKWTVQSKTKNIVNFTGDGGHVLFGKVNSEVVEVQ